jgi:hypothetical protein
MNFAIERHDSAPAEKRNREERRRLEIKICSPTVREAGEHGLATGVLEENKAPL